MPIIEGQGPDGVVVGFERKPSENDVEEHGLYCKRERLAKDVIKTSLGDQALRAVQSAITRREM